MVIDVSFPNRKRKLKVSKGKISKKEDRKGIYDQLAFLKLTYNGRSLVIDGQGLMTGLTGRGSWLIIGRIRK